jgi:Cell wall hydrolyses involved in spore germination
MTRSRMSWAIGVIAPWCLGIGLLVSFTADAGQNATIGGSWAVLNAPPPAEPDDLVPAQTAALTGDLDSFGLKNESLLTPISLTVGSSEDLAAVDDEIEPRSDLKRNAGAFPAIDRTHKGEPALGLRPTFDTRLRRPGGRASFIASQWISPHDDAMPAASFSLQDTGAPLDGATSFSPWAQGEDPQDARDEAEPHDGSAITMRPAALNERLAQGATPAVSRAEALSSTTPAQADGAPIEVSFSREQLRAPDVSVVSRSDGHPNYAALLVGEHGVRERKCLAEAVYFEARSEPEEGQAAVAQVVLNRATSGLYPASICGVVYQNRTHYRACQFSFACEGKSLRVTEPESWKTAVRIANEVVDGKTYVSDVGDATHYHAKYVRPGWARRLVKMDTIGHHIFYKLHQGQT